MSDTAHGSVQVRPANAADLDVMAQMGTELAQLHHAFDAARFMFADDPVQGYRWWFAREFQNPAACFYVAVVEQAVVGYVYGRLEEKNWNQE